MKAVTPDITKSLKTNEKASAPKPKIIENAIPHPLIQFRISLDVSIVLN